MIEEILKAMDILAEQEKIKKLQEEYKHARSLRKYEIWSILNKIGIKVGGRSEDSKKERII